MDRAQTTLDFLVGTTVFLLTVSAVLVTVPGLADPFVSGAEADTITADRAAERLAADRLVDSTAEPFVFQQSAVDSFFALSPADAKTAIGVDAAVQLNVTLSVNTVQEYQVGPAPGPETDTSVAWRSGRFGGDYAELVVRVW